MNQKSQIGSHTVSAIVSAWNEESTIENTVRALLDSPLVTEIVVLDDGSTDDTWGVIQRIQNQYPDKLHPVRFAHNKGKSYVMVEGVRQTTGNIILFMDADLVNINSTHIESLVCPLLSGEVDMTLGYMKTLGASRTLKLFRALSGQRAIFRDNIAPVLDKIEHSKYGVETLLNLHHIKNDLTIEYVFLKKVEHVLKQQKQNSYFEIFQQYYGEAKDIAKVLLLEKKDVTDILAAKAEEVCQRIPKYSQ